MNPNTIALLIALESVGLVMTASLFGGAVYLTVKANRDVKVMKEKYEGAKEAFERLVTDLNNL